MTTGEKNAYGRARSEVCASWGHVCLTKNEYAELRISLHQGVDALTALARSACGEPEDVVALDALSESLALLEEK